MDGRTKAEPANQALELDGWFWLWPDESVSRKDCGRRHCRHQDGRQNQPRCHLCWPFGSTILCNVFAAGLSNRCTRPFGQVISTRSNSAESPSPKWTVFEDCDRYPHAPCTCRVSILSPR